MFETKTDTVVFVGLAGELDRVHLKLRGPGKEARVLYPGEPEEATLLATATDEDAMFDVPLRRGCAMVILGKR